MSAISLDLLIRRDGTENNFCKLPSFEWSICDTPGKSASCNQESPDIPNNLQRMLYDSDGKMRPVIYQPSYIIFWHLGELFLEYALQSSKDDEAFPFTVIVHHAEFNLPIALLDDSRL